MTDKKIVMWVDDDKFLVDYFFSNLRDEGIDLISVTQAEEALDKVEELMPAIKLVVLDVMMPAGGLITDAESQYGYKTGLALARKIRQKYPNIPLLGCSNDQDPQVKDWFSTYGCGYIDKSSLNRRVVITLIKNLVEGQNTRRNPKCFIVHGHDNLAVLELKNYLQNTLGFKKPIVLREEPSLGRTIIEKFEEEAFNVDLVFILLTPDDKGALASDSNETKRRARQNVIFEMGYFFAQTRRRSGRVLLLHKGGVELPSDISGLIYIDISNGIDRAGEDMRRELKDWL